MALQYRRVNPRRPIHSWLRSLEFKTGEDELVIVENDEVTIARLAAEIAGETAPAFLSLLSHMDEALRSRILEVLRRP
jgi:hypothetical protein